MQHAGYDTSRMFADDLSKMPVPLVPTPQELTDLRVRACADGHATEKATPVYRGLPKYPYVAQLHSVEGWVELILS